MTEEIFPSPNHRKSFGRLTRERIAGALRRSHDIVNDTSQNVYEILLEALTGAKDLRTETEIVIPLLVEYALYGADDTGRDLGEASRGILQGVAKAAQELRLDPSDVIENTARAMILESDWRDVDLRIVIESFIRKSVPDGKNLVRRIFLSEKIQEETRKAA